MGRGDLFSFLATVCLVFFVVNIFGRVLNIISLMCIIWQFGVVVIKPVKSKLLRPWVQSMSIEFLLVA